MNSYQKIYSPRDMRILTSNDSRYKLKQRGPDEIEAQGDPRNCKLAQPPASAEDEVEYAVCMIAAARMQ